MDLPNSIERAYVKKEQDESVAVALKRILEKALPKYFDQFGNFKGINIHFTVPLYVSNGKTRVNSFTRYSMAIDEKTWELLNRAQTYTTMSKKNITEVIILKELLEGGEEENAKDRTLSYEQGNAADDRPYDQGKRACNA